MAMKRPRPVWCVRRCSLTLVHAVCVCVYVRDTDCVRKSVGEIAHACVCACVYQRMLYVGCKVMR